MSSSTPSPIPQEVSRPGRQVRYLPTLEAYDKWAEVYDSDSNALQALDDEKVFHLLPQLLGLLPASSDKTLRVIDLGCGTGRNTLKLLGIPGAEIYGLDLSPKMLDIAKKRCIAAWNSLPPEKRAISVNFWTHDVLDANSYTKLELRPQTVDIVISTLVVEHIPLATFFQAVDKLLVPGGLVLITNMHSEMGARSQAGFKDPVTGEKVRPVSYNHSLNDLVEAGKAAGYRLVGDSVLECRVDEELAKRLGPRAEKWIGVKMWMGGIFIRGGV